MYVSIVTSLKCCYVYIWIAIECIYIQVTTGVCVNMGITIVFTTRIEKDKPIMYRSWVVILVDNLLQFKSPVYLFHCRGQKIWNNYNYYIYFFMSWNMIIFIMSAFPNIIVLLFTEAWCRILILKTFRKLIIFNSETNGKVSAVWYEYYLWITQWKTSVIKWVRVHEHIKLTRVYKVS